MLWIIVGVGALILAYETRRQWQPNRLAGKGIPMKDRQMDPWSKLIQKGQVIVSEAFTSIGGYPIATDGRDFMYSPDVDEVEPSGMYQMENPQEIPLGV